MNAVLLLLLLQDFPPQLPGGRAFVTDASPALLEPPAGGLREGVAVARTPPEVHLMYFPGQTYPGRPWSAWGDSLWAGGRYYASIGDHLAPDGNALVWEYDPGERRFRLLVDVRRVLGLPEGHYTPGKIHGRLDRGGDGRLYFSTHRGSPKATTDQYHYRGDWILCHDPSAGTTEVVACGPVPRHGIPASVLDPERLIFYGGTAPGQGGEDEARFFAYDLRARKVLYSGPAGPSRALIFARSTGRVYWVPAGREDMTGPLLCWDPARGGEPRPLETVLGLRAATEEIPDGRVYTVSKGGRGAGAVLWAFDTKTEEAEKLGTAEVGTQSYIASIDADPSGRFLYYMPGAHGGSELDGTPVVQFDVRSRRKKVIAFLHAFARDRGGVTLKGTFSAALDGKGEVLYVAWNVSRGGRAWDCVALTTIRIPASER